MVAPELLEIVVCPKCRAPLSSKGGQLACGPCRKRFPQFSEIPWLFSHPEATWLDWRQKCDFQLQSYGAEMARLEQALSDSQLPQATRTRLELSRQALTTNQKAYAELLKPFLQGHKLTHQIHQSVQSQTALAQSLMGYYSNVFRDWNWGEVEFRSTWALLEQILPKGRKWGRTLVLGSGAGRLLLDLAERGAQVIGLEINPLLHLLGQKILAGQSLELFEFPIAPRSLADTAVKRELRAASVKAPNITLVFGDGLDAPFQPGVFDTVITPWFIDVVPEDTSSLAVRIHELLTNQGLWLNFGPYGFLQSAPRSQYSYDELVAIAAGPGFTLNAERRQVVPYLQSPGSCQRREEEILAFATIKTGPRPMISRRAGLPTWLDDMSLPVPKLEAFQRYAFANQVQLDALGLVDGTRSLTQIGFEFAKTHGLDESAGLSAVATLFRRLQGL